MSDDPSLKNEFDRQFELRTGLKKRDKSKYWNTTEGQGDWESQDRALLRKPVSRVLITLGVVVAIIVVTAIGTSLRSTTSPLVSTGPSDVQSEAREELSKIDLARQAVSDFLAATSVEGMAEFVRDPGRVLPLMLEYYKTHPLPESVPGENITLFSTRIMFTTKHSYSYVAAVEPSSLRPLEFILKDAHDHFEIDWECHVGYNQISFSEFIEDRPAEAQSFRVGANIDDFYNFGFSDRSRYQAFVLTAVDSRDVYLRGYADRNASFFPELFNLVNGRNGVPLILKLGIPPQGNGNDIVEILDLVQPHWVLE